MSGISEAASLLTIIKAVAILASATRELAKGFKNAPAELNALAAQLLALQSELELLKHTTEHGHAALLTDDFRKSIEESLISARNGVARLDHLCAKANEHERFSTRLRWIHKESCRRYISRVASCS